MGTVHLTNGHHGLYCRSGGETDFTRRVLLEEDMLVRPVYGLHGKVLKILELFFCLVRILIVRVNLITVRPMFIQQTKKYD